MTREEFIKIAILKGYTLEYAEILADMVVKSKRTYQEGYLICLKCLEDGELLGEWEVNNDI